jgi:hypothetical protein
MTVTITLTLAGSDTGPFNLYSNVDGYSSAFQTNVPKGDLVAGLTTGTVPNSTTEILVRSTGVCQRNLYLNVAGAPATTTTTSSTSSTSTTSTTTTPNPDAYYLADVGYYAKADGCPLGSVLRIFLDASDYALFVANGYSFEGLGGGAPTTCTAIARNQVGTPITALLYDSQNVSWKLTAGNFTYYEFQC